LDRTNTYKAITDSTIFQAQKNQQQAGLLFSSYKLEKELTLKNTVVN